MNAYTYQAALYCEDCAKGIMRALSKDCPTCGGFHADFPAVDCRAFYPPGKGPQLVPDNESLWDSDDFPKGPYANGGGEADSPQHCDSCGVFLENPLTSDGVKYVEAHIATNWGDGDVMLWKEFYGL